MYIIHNFNKRSKPLIDVILPMFCVSLSWKKDPHSFKSRAYLQYKPCQ